MILFKPTGTLDISTAATDLPAESDGNKVYSGAMQRCKNLVLERNAIACTRHGSSRATANALFDIANFIIEQGGDRYIFGGTYIYKNEVSIATGLTDAQWSGMKYNAFNDTTQRIFALNGTDRKKINGTTVSEWGITPPSVAPTLGVGGGTGLTGTYKVKYTYAVKSGSTVITESNPSGASSGQALSNQDLEVNWTASSDSQVTHVRIYRTLPSGDIYYHDQDVAIGAVTIDTSTADTALGTEVATNHDRPPLGSIVIGPLYNGICFIAIGNLLYWCLAKQPEYWPVNNFIEVGPPQFAIKAMVVLDGQLYCLTKNQIWWIQGTTSGAFSPVPFESLAGAPHQYGAVSVKGHGIYHIGIDGIYLYSNGKDRKVTQSNFEPIFPDAGSNNGMSTNGVQPVPASSTSLWLHHFQNRLYFHYSNGNVIVSDLETQKAWYHKYDIGLAAPATDRTNDQFLVGDNSKYVRQIEDPDSTDDVGTGIDWEIQTMDYTLQTRRHFPRWVKYDVDVDNATTVEGKIIFDGVIHHTHSITQSRNTARRLIDTGNANKCSMRMTGTGPAKIYAMESE